MMENKDKLSHLRNLILLAKADEIVRPEEEDFIAGVMSRERLTLADYDYCSNHIDSIDFAVPEDYGERIEYLYDMIRLMMIDGDIDDRELSICHDCAVMMTTPSTDHNRLVSNMIDLVGKEMTESGMTITHNGN
jgi:hypothetical protein